MRAPMRLCGVMLVPDVCVTAAWPLTDMEGVRYEHRISL
jgi:hypothetical protein